MVKILLLLAASAHAAPLVQPQDVAFSSFNVKAISVGTTTLPTSGLTVYGIIGSSTTTPTVTCTNGTPIMTVGSTSQFGSYSAGTLATGCTVTFGSGASFPSTPFCQCQANANLLVFASAVSKTAVTCTAATAMTGDVITWNCGGPP